MTSEDLIAYRKLRVAQYDASSNKHRYLSTACIHGGPEDLDSAEHRYCRIDVGHSGFKQPGKCKFCDALCICPCHQLYPASTELGSPQTPSTGSPE